ncbi:hypothetical protein TI05_06570 [Achromatium sp. WMS3]|nr:hypothetical protein TI05_06570 [Achromatium sp. WMS3]
MPCRMKRLKNIFVLLDYPVFWLNKNCVWIPAFAGITGGSFNGQQIFHQIVIPAKRTSFLRKQEYSIINFNCII